MAEYNSNANQKSITTHKSPTTGLDKDNQTDYYTKINLDALQNAMSSLTPKAFELWIYFSKNQDNYFFWLSKVDFLKWANISESSYRNAFKELVSNGYLIPKDDCIEPKQFDFYEIPKEEKIGITTHKAEQEKI
jgi:hypothetical protein